MSNEQEIRAEAQRLKAELEALQSRLSAMDASSDHAEAIALLSDFRAAAVRAFEAGGRLLGLTPAAVRLVQDESARLARQFRATGGEVTDEHIKNSKVGELLSGLRAARGNDGGEA